MKKNFLMAIGVIACIFLMAMPATADEASADHSPGSIDGVIAIILEWLGIAGPASDGLPPAENSGVGEIPELYPYLPPGG